MICMLSYWKNKIPRQGWLYLSVEYLCFYTYILGIEDKIVIRWADVVNLEKSSKMLSYIIRVTTRDKREVSGFKLVLFVHGTILKISNL